MIKAKVQILIEELYRGISVSDDGNILIKDEEDQGMINERVFYVLLKILEILEETAEK